MAFTSAKARPENDKRALHDALEEMRANASDPQRVYSCLVRMFDTLAASSSALPTQTELLVNAVVAPLSTVKFLQELMVLHVSQEEIQWYLCRIITLACRKSLRFQCQAGQLALWSDVFQVRSTHPSSMRVLETSLETYEALLNSNEFQLLTAQPAQKLIQEMLATIDRFAYMKSSSKSRSCEELRPEMAVKALRVLTTIYSYPRLQALVEEKNASFAEAITSRLKSTFSPIFLENELVDVKLWLRMCRLQIQQHRLVAVPGLFLSTAADGNTIKPWFVRLLEKWSDVPAIVYDFLALLTLVFALPHELGEHLDALAHELLDKRKLLGTICELLARYPMSLSQQTSSSSGEYHLTLTLLEIVRVLRQWSAIDTTLKSFASCSQVKTLLIPTLATQLHSSREQIQSPSSLSSSSSKRQQALQMALEILILLQNLTKVSASFKSTLTSAETLQISVRELKMDRTASILPSSTSDIDIDALVKREATKLAQLLVAPSAAANPSRQSSTAKAPIKKITSFQQQPSTRLLFTKPGLSPTRGSTRQLSSSSSSTAARQLRSSCSATKL